MIVINGHFIVRKDRERDTHSNEKRNCLWPNTFSTVVRVTNAPCYVIHNVHNDTTPPPISSHARAHGYAVFTRSRHLSLLFRVI